MPAPTVTPDLTPGCRNLVYNGSFENGLEGWTVSGPGVTVEEMERDPFRGAFFLRINPGNNRPLTRLVSRPFEVPPRERMTSATFHVFFRGDTFDNLPERDEFAVGIRNLEASCTFCYARLFTLHNDVVETRWRDFERDLLEDPRTLSSRARIEIHAENDIADRTMWDVDAVGVHVCVQ